MEVDGKRVKSSYQERQLIFVLLNIVQQEQQAKPGKEQESERTRAS